MTDLFASLYSVDLDNKKIWISALSIVFNPIFWNVMARLEYRKKVLTRLANGNSRLVCYCLAFTIFTLGLLRDYL